MGEPEVGDDFSIKFAYGEVTGTPVSMGNPHYVVFVPEFELGWQAVAQQISMHHDFKHGMNVEFVKVIDDSGIEVRFCERGVGETMSSGTGSCAAAVASIHAGRVKSPVRVHAPGGRRSWNGAAKCFLPDRQRCSVAASFSFKISLPDDVFAQSERLRPAALRPGDTVGIIAPASGFRRDDLEAGCAELLRLGYQPFYLPSIFERELYFAGSAQRRVDELHEMFVAARGEGDLVRARRLWLQLPAAASRS